MSCSTGQTTTWGRTGRVITKLNSQGTSVAAGEQDRWDSGMHNPVSARFGVTGQAMAPRRTQGSYCRFLYGVSSLLRLRPAQSLPNLEMDLFRETWVPLLDLFVCVLGGATPLRDSDGLTLGEVKWSCDVWTEPRCSDRDLVLDDLFALRDQVQAPCNGILTESKECPFPQQLVKWIKIMITDKIYCGLTTCQTLFSAFYVCIQLSHLILQTSLWGGCCNSPSYDIWRDTEGFCVLPSLNTRQFRVHAPPSTGLTPTPYRYQ